MTKKLISVDLDIMSDNEVLEFLLFGQIPRKDTNGLARELIETYGSLKHVLQAEPHELFGFRNMTERAAAFLPIILKVAERVKSQAELSTGEACPSQFAIAKYFVEKLRYEKYERLYVMALTSGGHPTDVRAVSVGDRTSIEIDYHELSKAALLTKSRGIIVAHNHPCSSAYPSDVDVVATSLMFSQFKSMDMKLVDHLIVAGDTYFSFAAEGLIKEDGVVKITAKGIKDKFALRNINRTE